MSIANSIDQILLYNRLRDAFVSIRTRCLESIRERNAQSLVGGIGETIQTDELLQLSAILTGTIIGTVALTKGLEKYREYAKRRSCRADHAVPPKDLHHETVLSGDPWAEKKRSAFEELKNMMNTNKGKRDWIEAVRHSFEKKLDILKKSLNSHLQGPEVRIQWHQRQQEKALLEEKKKKARETVGDKKPGETVEEYESRITSQIAQDTQSETKSRRREGDNESVSSAIKKLENIQSSIDYLTKEINDLGDEKQRKQNIAQEFATYLEDKMAIKEGIKFIDTHKEVWDFMASLILNFIISGGKDEYIYSKSLAFALLGPAGAGKTFLAKQMAVFLSTARIIPMAGDQAQISPNDLVSGYKGGTRIKTNDVLYGNLLRGLILDEAYNLAAITGGTEEHPRFDDYGADAAAELIAFMTGPEASLVTIFALGYKNEMMKTFFKINIGMESRFTLIITLGKIDAGVFWKLFEKQFSRLRFSKKAECFIKAIATDEYIFPNSFRDMQNFGALLDRSMMQAKDVGVRSVWQALDDYLLQKDKHIGKTGWLKPPYEVFEITSIFKNSARSVSADKLCACGNTHGETIHVSDVWQIDRDPGWRLRSIYRDYATLVFSKNDDLSSINNAKNIRYVIQGRYTETPNIKPNACFLYTQEAKIERVEICINPANKEITRKY